MSTCFEYMKPKMKEMLMMMLMLMMMMMMMMNDNIVNTCLTVYYTRNRWTDVFVLQIVFDDLNIVSIWVWEGLHASKQVAYVDVWITWHLFVRCLETPGQPISFMLLSYSVFSYWLRLVTCYLVTAGVPWSGEVLPFPEQGDGMFAKLERTSWWNWWRWFMAWQNSP